MPYYGYIYDFGGTPQFVGPGGTYPGWDDLAGKPKDKHAVADVDAYFATALNGKTWTGLDKTVQEQALAEAHRWLGSLCWKTGEACCGRDYDQALTMAVSELALLLAQNPQALITGLTANPGLYVSDQRLGDLGQSFAAFPGAEVKYGTRAPLLFQRLPWLADLLHCWVEYPGNARVLSRC
jgi:hypothetical protein